jgi:hypothetical protein
LENIFTKPLAKAQKRIQCMLIQLQNYNVTVSYAKGKSLHLADALSRAYINDQPHSDERSIEKANSLIFIKMSDQRVKSIAEATLTDPRSSINLSRHLQQFIQHCDELTHHNGWILKVSISNKKEPILGVQPLDYASPQQQSRPNASMSTSANENQIIQTGRYEMTELTNSSCSSKAASKAATTPTRNSSPNFSNRSYSNRSYNASGYQRPLSTSTLNSSSMEVFNRTSSDSRNLYLTPSSTLTPIIGRPKRRIRQPVRFADYVMDDSLNRGDVI